MCLRRLYLTYSPTRKRKRGWARNGKKDPENSAETKLSAQSYCAQPEKRPLVYHRADRGGHFQPFFGNIARTIEDEAKRNNYTVIFGSSDENLDKSGDLINVLLNRQVDGLILIPTEGSRQQIKQLRKQPVPFVLIDRYFPQIPVSQIGINNFGLRIAPSATWSKQGISASA